jgi:hypothetical protein
MWDDVGCGMWDVGCGIWDVGCGMWDVGCGMWDVGCGMWEARPRGDFYLDGLRRASPKSFAARRASYRSGSNLSLVEYR